MDEGLTWSEILEIVLIIIIVGVQIGVAINTWLHIKRYKGFIADDEGLKLKSYFVPGNKLKSLSVEEVQGNEIYTSRNPSVNNNNADGSHFIDTDDVPDIEDAMQDEAAIPQEVEDEWAEEYNSNSPILSRGTSKDNGRISFSNVPVSEEDAMFKITPGNKSGDIQYGRFEPYLPSKERIMKFYRSKRAYDDCSDIQVVAGPQAKCEIIKSGTVRKEGQNGKWIVTDKCSVRITF